MAKSIHSALYQPKSKKRGKYKKKRNKHESVKSYNRQGK